MTPAPLDDRQRTRLHELFCQAVELPGDQQAAFCARGCGGDRRLEAELLALLESAQQAEDEFLDEPVLSGEAVGGLLAAQSGLQDAVAGVPEPERIGPYRIVRRLGDGGMGVVYLAEQEHPIRRSVALKVIKPGLDTERVVRRFEAERQALARMDHPGVARIHDAGTTDAGRPYFVMEFVEGTPMAAHCDQEGASIPQRLALFAQLCDAVQHAHQKGVIHRDLKPSNVLVTVRDGHPTPVVIDFGIARAVADPQHDPLVDTLLTRQHEQLGTPEYAAPEQTDGSGADVDSRADIYSLGVMLFELLTGSRPVAQHTPATAARQRTPTAPSARLARGSRPRAARELRGELDWITMKALEPDRERRYDSASELAADVRRYLAREPVAAGPPTVWYRLHSFVRRNRSEVTIAAIVLTALLVGGVLATVGLVRARRLAADLEVALENAESSSNLLVEWLGMINLENGPLRKREMLDQARLRVPEQFAGRPRAAAEVHKVLGATYASISETELAIEQFARALELFESLDDVTPFELQEILWLYSQPLEVSIYNERKLPLWNRVLDVSVHAFADDRVELARAMTALAWESNVLRFEARADAVLDLAERHLGANDSRWLTVADFLSVAARLTFEALARSGQVADSTYDAIEEIYLRRVGLEPTRRRILLTRLHHLQAVAMAGQHARSLAMAESLAPLLEDTWPADHTFRALLLLCRGICATGLGRPEGFDRMEECLVVLERTQDNGNPVVVTLECGVRAAERLQDAQRAADFRKRLLDVVVRAPFAGIQQRIVELLLEPTHPELLAQITDCKSACREAGILVPEVVELTAHVRDEFGVDSKIAALVAGWMLGWQWRWVPDPKAYPVAVPTLEFCVEALSDSPANMLAVAYRQLCDVHCGAGEYGQALRVAESLARLQLGVDRDVWRGIERYMKGRALAGLNRPGAESELLEAHRRLAASAGWASPLTAWPAGVLQDWAARTGAVESGLAFSAERLEGLWRRKAGPRRLHESLWALVQIPESARATAAGSALAVAERCCALAPQAPHFRLALGVTLLRLQRPRDALRELDRAQELQAANDEGAPASTTTVSIAAFRAVALARSGRGDAARAEWDRARVLAEDFPDNPFLRLQLDEAATAVR